MTRSVERHWQRARRYLQERQLPAARAQLESLRALAPGGVRTRLLAAQIAWHEDHLRDAAAHALDAAQVVPDEPEVLCDAIDTLLQVGESAVAHELLDRPVWDEAEADDTLLRYADFRQRFGEHTQTLAALDRLISRHSADGLFRCYRGQQMRFLGRLDEAEAEYEASLALAPGYGRAAYELVRMRTQRRADKRLDLIETGLQRAAPGSREQADFEFARYHVLEDLGQTDAAWQALATANAVTRGWVADDAARQLVGLQRFHEHIVGSPAKASSVRHTGPCPIFILGMPRSGTTVLERMLGNHSCVVSLGELVDFGQQLLRVADTCSNYSAAFLARLPTLDFAEVGRRYLAQTAWRAGGKPYLIDKQPANWMVAGLIHAALPEAKILHLVRDPMDVGFSNWRARFGDACAWSYDFATLAAHYGEYHRLMRHWHTTYPGAIMDVEYAALVRDPTATLRKVLEFCGLAWEDGCDDLTRNATSVSTLSAAAVREPVHTRGIGQWRRYAAQLEPLRKGLLPYS